MAGQDAYDRLYTSIFRVPVVFSMFGGGPSRNRRSPFYGPQTGDDTEFLGLSGDVLSSPTVGPDGTVYIGTEGNRLYAINPDLSIKWQLSLSNDVKSSPLVYDGVVYFGSDDNRFRAVSADTGATVHPALNVGSDVRTSPAVADGIIYFGAGDERIYAVNPDLTVLWTYKTSGDIDSSPAVSPVLPRADGRQTRTLVVGSDDNYLYALDADPNPALTREQRLLWRRSLGRDVEATPAIGDRPDHTVYVGSENDRFYALSIDDGTILWSEETNPDLDVDASAAVGTDGTVYYGGDDNRMWARNPDGSLAWFYEVGGDINSSPTLDASGVLYFGADDKFLYALEATPASMSDADRLVFKVQMPGRAKTSSVTIAPNRTLYIGVSDSDGLFVVHP